MFVQMHNSQFSNLGIFYIGQLGFNLAMTFAAISFEPKECGNMQSRLGEFGWSEQNEIEKMRIIKKKLHQKK